MDSNYEHIQETLFSANKCKEMRIGPDFLSALFPHVTRTCWQSLVLSFSGLKLQNNHFASTVCGAIGMLK